MLDESELIANLRNVGVLALKCVNDIEIPVCGSLSKLTSKECFDLMVIFFCDFYLWSNPNSNGLFSTVKRFFTANRFSFPLEK